VICVGNRNNDLPAAITFFVSGVFKSPQKRSLQVIRHLALRICDDVQTLRERATILRHAYIAFFVHGDLLSTQQVVAALLDPMLKRIGAACILQLAPPRRI
jgi:hypothetical protein